MYTLTFSSRIDLNWIDSEFTTPPMLATCPGPEAAKQAHGTATTMIHRRDKVVVIELGKSTTFPLLCYDLPLCL